ncbi:Protein of unknown function (DUF751) [Pleodorina starrii]|uniref:Uncharacterized protein ycf33 n=1 Tax=Pleodorina starrii TaxID=330485 RepID=A0A9W6BYA8_9CHLO|nr:Protein of unknown function (DUF751) [Pleodorina starrii]GLC59751.1 Protein of unknown function (DUF751) [Pleodorina starrii]GLC75326.1 Protein of unknown function (DUF751) [Pleodorina starrii]
MQSTIKVSRAFTSAPRVQRSSQRVRKNHIRVAAQRGSNECSTSGSDNLWWRSLATLDLQKAQPVAAAALLALGVAATAGAASAAELSDVHHAQPLAELAEQDFWGNIVRYGRYFVTVMLGTGYVMLRPFQSMLKRPVTAVFAIAALVALVLGTRVALEFMLGINEYDYNPENFRIASQY